MSKVFLRLLFWMLVPVSWLSTILTKRLVRSGNAEEIARACYEDGMISAEQYEAVKRGEIDVYDATKKGYPGRKIVLDGDGNIRGEK